MSSHTYHRGIGFSVRELMPNRWTWSVHPPKSVKGLKKRTGEIMGERSDAIAAAKREIESQDASVYPAAR